MSKLASARPVPAHEYREGQPGFLVEADCQTGFGDGFAIPAWEEMGCAELCETFATEADAFSAIHDAQQTWL